jgi:hypothetical protein
MALCIQVGHFLSVFLDELSSPRVKWIIVHIPYPQPLLKAIWQLASDTTWLYTFHGVNSEKTASKATWIHKSFSFKLMRCLLPCSLQTTFVYIPAIRPDPPSALRTLAYQENSPLLGPQQDPSGWYSLPSAKVCGTLFGNRVVEVTCRLFLAKPVMIFMKLS